MVDLLLAAHEQGVDAVEAACQTALNAGLRSADAVLNILSRQNEPIICLIVSPFRRICSFMKIQSPIVHDNDRITVEVHHGAS